MKANAPEKIWIDPATDLPKLSGHIDKDSVEYVRRDVFIERAKEVDLEKEFESFLDNIEGVPRMWHSDEQIEWAKDIAKHFFELGLKAQKGEDSVNDGLKETQKNIWRSLDEKPSFPISNDELLCSILVLYNNGNMFLYRYGKNGIPNDLLTPHFCNIINAKWCYCKDVINK